MIPHSKRYDDGLQLSYELPHRVHAANVYPVPSPNESTIIIYGHESGLRVLWRGGRPFKARRGVTADDTKPRPNGSTSDAILIIDSDDEEPPANTGQSANLGNETEFDSDEEEDLPRKPYKPIIQHLDILLRTEVLHLVVPDVGLSSDKRYYNSIPALFRQKIVVAVACEDCSVRLITLPLTPPSPARKAAQGPEQAANALEHGRKGFFGEQMMILGSPGERHSIPNAVDVTWTDRDKAVQYEKIDVAEDELSEDNSDLAGLSRSFPRKQSTNRAWALLMATHTPEVSGILRIYELPILSEGGQDSLATESLKPFQTLYLTHPAASVSFNRSHYPSTRHSQVMLADTSGAVRIYDCSPTPKTHSQLMKQFPPSGQRGLFLITLLPPFGSPRNGLPVSVITAKRKRVLAAQWILSGRGVIVLLDDGEWGIWDVEGVGPGAQKGLCDGTPGISGGGITKFALRGYVGISQPLSTESDTSSGMLRPRSNEQKRLAPMTPHTRKVREESLFSGPAHSTGLSKGGICVTADTSPGRLDDSIILWYNNSVYTIPSLMTLWQRSVSGSGGGGSLHGPALKRFDHLDLYGEFINGVQHIPTSDQPPSHESVLVTAEHRLIILDRSARKQETARQLFAREQAPEQTRLVTKADQQLLERGQLDLGGVDRLLDSMQGSQSGLGFLRARKVGFAS